VFEVRPECFESRALISFRSGGFVLRYLSRSLFAALLLFGITTAVASSQAVEPPSVKAPKGQFALPDTLSPQGHPAPTATPSPSHVSVSGRARAYDFQRLNKVQNASNPDRHSLEFALEPHIDYHIGDTPLNIGYTYGGATGFGFNGPNPITNPHVDNTLPGYPLDMADHELYLQYKDANDTFTAGNMELNYPWIALSDSRVIPEAYQGIDGTVRLTSWLDASATRVTRFEARNSSNFESNTLLTAPYPGTSSLFKGSGHETPGTLRIEANFHPSARFVLSAENDQFYNIANLAYAEAKYGIDPYSKVNPYLAVQYVAEGSLGQNQVGRVANHTIGAQLGLNLAKGLTVIASSDVSPVEYAYVRAKSLSSAESKYFVGGGGTGDGKSIGGGIYKIAYGGIASPYTDSLGTDPLYTTMITQGMADRRSAGEAYKTAFIYTPPNKQWKLLAAEAWWNYSNAIARNLTSEFDVDGTYYFNKVRPGPYHGFFVRVRIAPRQQPTLPYSFEYQRFITEYDF
jgi:hypothetical protein